MILGILSLQQTIGRVRAHTHKGKKRDGQYQTHGSYHGTEKPDTDTLEADFKRFLERKDHLSGNLRFPM